MEALRFETEVAERGALRVPRLPLKPGTPVEVIILVRQDREEFADLTAAAETSLDFWDNPIDDEVWNDA